MRYQAALIGIPFVQVRLVDIVAPLPLSGIPVAQESVHYGSHGVFG